MKKITTLLLSALFVLSFVVMINAEDMEKGSMMDKGSMMGDVSTIDLENALEAAHKAEVVENAEDSAEDVIEDGSITNADSNKWGKAYSAKANIKGTSEDSQISGSVDFIETGDGVQVVASLSGVAPAGKHGIHIYQNGSCDDGGKAAGGHFNPAGTKHGLLPRDGHEKAHGGDMGNIEIGENGKGSLIVFLPGLSLTDGDKNVAQKAVILHAKEDNFGQPTGNAGGRVGCGIINLNN